MKPYIYPYKMKSGSAKELVATLQQQLNRKVWRVYDSSRTFRHRPNRLVINWGNNRTSLNFNAERILNHPDKCAVASNKLRSFEALEGKCNIPEFTTDIAIAEGWEGIVVARTTLTGHSGQGIVFSEEEQPLVKAPLYVKYKKKKKEFRVHVFREQVIDIQEKRKERAIDDVDYRVRNRAGGWVFCRDGIVEPADLRTNAVAAVAALELDFGAVDVIYNEKEDKCYVLEVNTAPGLEGTTLEKYSQAILQLL